MSAAIAALLHDLRFALSAASHAWHEARHYRRGLNLAMELKEEIKDLTKEGNQ